LEEHYNRFAGELRLTDFHKEHVDCNGSDDLSNCVPSCKTCNSSKHTEKLEDWYAENNSIFNKDRFDKIHKWLDNDWQEYYIEKKPRKKYTKKDNT
jgi:hypothetical protein